MAELADAQDLESCDYLVQVQVLLSAPTNFGRKFTNFLPFLLSLGSFGK